MTSILIVILMMSEFPALRAQVTIGSNIPPKTGALLDLKESETSGSNLVNSTKGLLLPRVSLVSRQSMAPLIASATEEEKRQSAGMIVYNLLQTPDLFPGLNIWDGTKWVLVASIDCISNVITAEFTVASTTVRGSYVKGVDLTPLNFLSIVLDISVPGKYIITGTTGNGYDYLLSGEFPATGVQTVNVPGGGTPVLATSDLSEVPDTISVKINNEEVSLPNRVLSKPSDYLVDCNTLTVNGTYVAGASLNPATNYLTIQGITTAPSAGGSYEIKTDTVNGYSFTKSGLLTSGGQTFTISPTNLTDKPLVQGLNNFTLTTNSGLSAITCPFTIKAINPALSMYISNVAYAGYPTSMTNIAGNINNYGPNGIYDKVEKINSTTGANANVITNMTNKATDVTIINYSMTMSSTEAATALAYIKSGKILIYAVDNTTDPVAGAVSIVAGLLGVSASSVLATYSTTTNAEAGIIINSTTLTSPNSNIINGPFGNTSGLSFARDGDYNWKIDLASSVTDTSVRNRFTPIAKVSDGTARILLVEDSSSNGALILLTDGGAWANLATSGYETKKTLFSNILAWATDRLNN